VRTSSRAPKTINLDTTEFGLIPPAKAAAIPAGAEVTIEHDFKASLDIRFGRGSLAVFKAISVA
jgi:hypothetical protein